MSDSTPSDSSRPEPSHERHLPPVEPPSATFLIQLFVVPAVIVALIVAAWLAFTWLASRGEDPRTYVEGLKRPGPKRWQTAHNLAETLRGRRHEDFKRDGRAAAELAKLLDKEIDDTTTQFSRANKDEYEPVREQLQLRIFLARALGEFYVADGIPVLLRGATTRRFDEELETQLASIEGLAVLIDNLAAHGSPPERPDDPKLEQTLLQLAGDDEPHVRSAALFALGVLATPAATEKLADRLDDPDRDVRHNAALGLSRQGDLRAAPVLEKMLQPPPPRAGQTPRTEREKQRAKDEALKKAAVLANATRAVKLLADAHPQADLSSLLEALEQLSESDRVEKQIAIHARETLNGLKRKMRDDKGNVE